VIDQSMRACSGPRYALAARNIPKSVRPRPIHAWRSMIGQIVVAYAGAIVPRRHLPLARGSFRCRLERFKAGRTVEPTVKIRHLRQHRHAVVLGLNPDRGAGTMIVQERTHLRVWGSFQRSQMPAKGEQGRTVGRSEEMRLLRTFLASPFEKSARRHNRQR
jgi:hypothetical protein